MKKSKKSFDWSKFERGGDGRYIYYMIVRGKPAEAVYGYDIFPTYEAANNVLRFDNLQGKWRIEKSSIHHYESEKTYEVITEDFA